MAGPLAKNIADEYDVDPRKSASILDIFGGVSRIITIQSTSDFSSRCSRNFPIPNVTI